MNLIGLLIGVLVLTLFMYMWLSGPANPLTTKTDYQQINQQMDQTQEQVDKYNQTVKDYEQQIQTDLNGL